MFFVKKNIFMKNVILNDFGEKVNGNIFLYECEFLRIFVGVLKVWFKLVIFLVIEAEYVNN